jgi:hypothetical protein
VGVLEEDASAVGSAVVVDCVAGEGDVAAELDVDATT